MRGNFDADQVFAPYVLQHRRTSTLDRELRCLEDVFEAMSRGEDMLGRDVQICLEKERIEEQLY